MRKKENRKWVERSGRSRVRETVGEGEGSAFMLSDYDQVQGMNNDKQKRGWAREKCALVNFTHM
jgi:hypothetical protein